MTNKLSDFGSDFQIKIISSLLSDIYYLAQITDIIKPEYFDNGGNRFIVEKILSYYHEYKAKPTVEIFKVELAKMTDVTLKANVKQNLISAFENIDSTDLKFIQDETLTFCKNQVLKQAILDSVDLLEVGEYDEIQHIIKEASNAGTDKNVGHEYKTHIEERYNEDPRNPIKTPWPIINEITGGGLGAGELAVIVGKYGGGKSWNLINIAAQALKDGKNVLFYTLELSAKYVGKRFDSFFTEIDTTKLEENLDTVKLKMKDVKGELIIKEYPTSSATFNTLNAHIEKVKSFNFIPDMVCIDYIDLMKAVNVGSNKRDDQVLEGLYKDARGFGQEHNCLIISPSQSNRNGEDSDIIEGKTIGGAYAKLAIADFVMSQNRTLKDKTSNTGKMHIIKNRLGPDGMSFPAYIDLSIGKIQIYDENSSEGRQIEEERQAEPTQRNFNPNPTGNSMQEVKNMMNRNTPFKY